MKLYVTRHGETEWNLQRKLCGTTDIPLTKMGEEQAQELAQKLLGKGVEIIFTSPLQRAVRTAQIVGDTLGLSAQVEPRIIERSFGEREGSAYNDVQVQREWPHFARSAYGGETLLRVSARIYPFLDEIRKTCADKTVLLVSHGAAIRVIHSYFNSMDNNEFSAFRTKNCELREYDI